MKKYLIIRFSSIGDIVLTTPVVRCLKEQTGAEVHYLSKQQFKGLLEPNPHIDKLHLIADKVDEILPALQKEDFDEIIDLHNNLRTLQVKRALNIPAYSFP
jgi:heptosyltransferase-2